ncbi:hypothetical protein EJB05_08900, partial [Eragrostis curvula]
MEEANAQNSSGDATNPKSASGNKSHVSSEKSDKTNAAAPTEKEMDMVNRAIDMAVESLLEEISHVVMNEDDGILEGDMIGSDVENNIINNVVTTGSQEMSEMLGVQKILPHAEMNSVTTDGTVELVTTVAGLNEVPAVEVAPVALVNTTEITVHRITSSNHELNMGSLIADVGSETIMESPAAVQQYSGSPRQEATMAQPDEQLDVCALIREACPDLVGGNDADLPSSPHVPGKIKPVPAIADKATASLELVSHPPAALGSNPGELGMLLDAAMAAANSLMAQEKMVAPNTKGAAKEKEVAPNTKGAAKEKEVAPNTKGAAKATTTHEAKQGR